MLGLGMGEILIIGLVLLIVVGPDRLPHAMRSVGKHYAKLRRMASEMRQAFVIEADRMDAEERVEEARKQANRADKAPHAPPADNVVAQERPLPGLEEDEPDCDDQKGGAS